MRFIPLTVRDIVDILLVTVIIYHILKLFKGTRTIYIIIGLLAVIALSVLSTFFNLKGVIWLLSAFTRYGLLALIVIFQPEIRKGLAIIGTGPFMGERRKIGIPEIQEIERAIRQMVQRGLGGIIIFEKNMMLEDLISESGVKIHAAISAPLIVSIFLEDSPLHDGAIIIRSNFIVGARVVLPLSQVGVIEGSLGTRHRAALGITEQSDCLAIVISEERRSVRIAQKGVLSESLTFENIRTYLEEILIKGAS
ncbi:MAG TPA: diadenylate cyclase CdaA [Candidatus Hydrothermia bacterium]|nr:diadenylate cyclase CdaA [Candidatus Hydrothermae bacterium]MDD3648732.1 diadenylate cyclase CdaA [Candidatus Hydrothermia bacterium]MDD5573463.1 diadenylate cyclase CdaA [Candidatus Hydrothermia bacterium]HOK22408.1 diadenylate cyclase CdaA [Candidatus Hydrothermia bacterium]HOL23115.1 diadenylate cyclase CdaA [Candidatus Hydrothermia bacterium]